MLSLQSGMHMRAFLRTVGKHIGRHWILGAFILLVLGFVMTPYRLERFFVYYPSRQLEGNPGNLGLAYDDLTMTTEDNLKLHGWFVPCGGARTTVLIFHGNAGNISHRLPYIELLHELGVNVFLFDYRGYGNSEGKPFEKGLYRDARAAYEWWLQERPAPGERLILFGESLGGAVAVHLGARVSASALILQSTFTSARDMAKTMMPLGLLLPLTGLRLDSKKDMAKIACPKLIIHGTSDEIVPFRIGELLYEITPPPKYFYAVPRAGHNDVLWVAGAEYGRQIKGFLAKIQ
jgi:fermentation-respiration switch protein FrsA (DUF1100 family)